MWSALSRTHCTSSWTCDCHRACSDEDGKFAVTGTSQGVFTWQYGTESKAYPFHLSAKCAQLLHPWQNVFMKRRTITICLLLNSRNWFCFCHPEHTSNLVSQMSFSKQVLIGLWYLDVTQWELSQFMLHVMKPFSCSFTDATIHIFQMWSFFDMHPINFF